MKFLTQILLFTAFLTQGMIPAGFMLNVNAANAATPLIICSGIEEKTVWVDHNGAPVDETPAADHETSKPCLFSAPVPATGTAAAQVSQPVASFPAKIAFLTVEDVLLSVSTQRPPAIGPPYLI